MIHVLGNYEVCKTFVETLKNDSCHSDSMLSTKEQVECNLLQAFSGKKNKKVFGVFEENLLEGIFSLLILPEEKYIEVLVSLSSKETVYKEFFSFCKKEFAGYEIDFVFNPDNCELSEVLKKNNAHFFTEQLKMVFTGIISNVDVSDIMAISKGYEEQYCALHCKDSYWTGEKVLNSQDKFHTYLALKNDEVIGYIDVTYTNDENEPYDIFIKEGYRQKGYGRKLLSKALYENQGHGMMALIDVDNYSSIALFESCGFMNVKKQNSITAQWFVEQ